MTQKQGGGLKKGERGGMEGGAGRRWGRGAGDGAQLTECFHSLHEAVDSVPVLRKAGMAS
jgi:hypothetical protein